MAGILALFLIVQYGVLLVASLISLTSSFYIIKDLLASAQSVYLSYLTDVILVIALLLIMFNRHKKHGNKRWNHKFFVVFEAVVLIATSSFAFLFMFSAFLPRAIEGEYLLISVVAATLLILLREEIHSARNLATITSSVGVGLVLGFYIGLYYGFYIAIIIMAIFSIYDYISVFVTKSMIKLAKTLNDQDVGFFVTEEDIVAIPENKVGRKDVKEYKNYLHAVHEDKIPLFKHLLMKKELPIISDIELGEGDLGVPLMVTVSAYYAFSNMFLAVFIITGAMVGMIMTMLFLKRYRRPLPAIPPLFSFISIFLATCFLITKLASLYVSLILTAAGILVLMFGMVYTLSRKDNIVPERR